MAQQIDIVANLLMKVDGAEAGINKLKSSLSKLKMPEGLENSFKKSFSNLDTIFAKYRSQVEKGFNTKGDVSAFSKTSKELDAELNRISRHFTELTGKQIDFKVKSDSVIKAEKDLQNLIDKKNQLSKETLQIKITGGKNNSIEELLKTFEKIAGTSTKAGQAAGNALVSLQQGNLSATINYLKQAETGYKKLGEAKKKAFQDNSGISMGAAIQQMSTEVEQVRGKFDNLDSSIDNVTNDLANFRTDQIRNAGDYLEKQANSYEQLSSSIHRASGEAQEYARTSSAMAQQLGDLQQSTQYFFSLRNMINLFKRGVQDAIQSVKELDKAMTDTAVVTDYSVSDMWGMLPQYTKIANELGATTQGAYETMTLYFQQGLDQQQAFELGAETMKMARIAGLDYAKTTDMMTAALRGFNMELNETSAKRINDVYSELAARTASDTQEIGEAMERTASIAHSAGMSFEGTSAFLAQMIETTREAPENLGTAMKTIIARFQELKKNPLEMQEVDGEEVSFNKVDAALQTIGVSLKDTNGQFRELDKVFLDIAQRWDGLTQTQQRYIATTAAGSRQQSRFIAMMSNYSRTAELMGYANDSAGASQKQFEKTMDSLESKLNQLHNAWQQFTMGIANNSMIKGAVDGITSLLGHVNSLIDTLSLGSGTLKSFLSLFMAFTGLKAAGKIINGLVGGLGGLLDPQSSFGKGFFGGGFLGRRNESIQAQASAIYTPIVAELRALRGQQQSLWTKQSGPYEQYNAFKKGRQDLRDLTKGQQSYNVQDVIGKLNKLTPENQMALMKTMPGTSRALRSSLINQYGNLGFNSNQLKEIQTIEKSMRNDVQRGKAPLAEYYKAMTDPNKLLAQIPKDSSFTIKPLLQKLSADINTEANRLTSQQLFGDSERLGKLNEKHQQEIINKAIQRGTISQKQLDENYNQALINKGYGKAQNTKKDNAFDAANKFAAGIQGAGMAITSFGTLLSNSANPAVQSFGNAISSLGGVVTNIGMAFSGLIAATEAVTSSKLMEAAASKLGIGAGQLTAGLGILVAAIAGTALAIKAHRDNIRKEAEKITSDYKDRNEKAQTNINNLKSWQADFARLSAGVDQNGYNINLSQSDYDRYLEIARGLAEINPAIVDGYNAQGQAIINNNKALEDTLKLEEQHQKEAFTDYTSPEAMKALKNARDLSRQRVLIRDTLDPKIYNQGEGYEFAPQAEMRKNAQRIGALLNAGIKQGWASEDLLKDFNINISKLAKGDEATLQKFNQLGPKIQQRINSAMDSAGDKIKDSTKESMLSAFTGYSEASDELDELINPMYEQLMTKMGTKSAQIPEEFRTYFNQGLKAIVSDANVKDVNAEANKLADHFSVLTSEGSDYYKVMDKVAEAQDNYAATLNKTEYDKAANDAVNSLQSIRDELGKNVDLSSGYGQAISEFLDNEINKIRNFTEEGAANLSQALNTMTDEIAAAEGALENFNSVAEGSNYSTASSNLAKIYEEATSDVHTAGLGDQTFWTGAEALVGREDLKGKTQAEAQEMMSSVNEMLKGGQEGWDNFKIRWFDSVEEMGGKLIDANGKAIEGITYDENGWFKTLDENINPQVYEQVAEALDMSKDSLIAMLNLGRQFGEVDFSNIDEARKALSTSDAVIAGNSTDKNGNRSLWIKENSLYSELAQAGITDINAQEEKIAELAERNVNVISKASEMTIDQFQDMGIKSMDSLIDIFDSTGQFTKDEMAEYAKQWAELNNLDYNSSEFNEKFNEHLNELENGEAVKQTNELSNLNSTTSSIESILASMRIEEGHLDNPQADQLKQDILGGKGADTIAQLFSLGKNEKGQELTKTEYDATRKELVASQQSITNYLKTLQDNRDKAQGEERDKFDTEIANVSKYLDFLNKYIENGDAAWKQKEQERAQAEAEKNAIKNQAEAENEKYKQRAENANQVESGDFSQAQQQLQTMMNDGFTNLFSSIDPQQMMTPEVASAIGTLYNSYLTQGAQQATPQIQQALSTLGISLEDAIKAGLIIDEPGLASTAQSEYEGASEGAKDALKGAIDTAKTASEGASSAASETSSSLSSLSGKIAKSVEGFASDINNITLPALKTPEISTSVTKGIETVSNIATEAVAATLTVDNNEANSKLEETQQIAQQAADVVNKGATFRINVPGADKLTKASEAATSLSKKAGTQTIGVKTGKVDTGTVKSATSTIKSTQADINVGANTSEAYSKVNQLLSSVRGRSAYIDIEAHVRKTGINSITIDGKTVNVRTGASGINNNISTSPMPLFGSAAKGRYGTVGPKDKGGLTLTGEKGFEIAWLPSENRSMILGANGPQMLNLPSDAVVYTHEQSKKIIKQKPIPAGSHYATSKGATDPRKTKTSSSNNKSGGSQGQDSATTKQNAKNANNAAKVIAKVGWVSVWWENMSRRVDATQKKYDKNAKDLEKHFKTIGTTINSVKNLTDAYRKNLNLSIALNKQEVEQANFELKELKRGKNWRSKQEISYSVKGDDDKSESKKETIDLGNFITYNSTYGTWEISQKAIDLVAKGGKDSKGRKVSGNKEKAEAIKQSAEKEINDRNSKLKTAEDNIAKAQEALEKLSNDMYETFYRWEKSINKIYLLSQRLETLGKQQTIQTKVAEIEYAKMSIGIQTAAEAQEKVNKALREQNSLLAQEVQGRNQAIVEARQEFDSALNFKIYEDIYKANKNSSTAQGDFEAAKMAFNLLSKAGLDSIDTFDYSKALAQLNSQRYSKETYDAIKQVLDKIFEKQNNLNDSVVNAEDTVLKVYQQLEEYQTTITDFEESLLDGMEKEAEKQISRLDKINTTLSKAYKELIDEVKNKLDERRKQEDNQKTESELSQKQQRLSMLRADTSGGHAVEIAQLEKEIADAQQNYQRSLEDQLIEKLQRQGDEAEKQRQKQIDLLSIQNEIAKETGTNLAEVKELLSKPTSNKDAIKKIWLANQGYDETTIENQKKLENEFEVAWSKYVAAWTQKNELMSNDALIGTFADISKYDDAIYKKLDSGIINVKLTDAQKKQVGWTATDFAKDGKTFNQLLNLGFTQKGAVQGLANAKGLDWVIDNLHATAKALTTDYGFTLAQVQKAYNQSQTSKTNKNYMTDKQTGAVATLTKNGKNVASTALPASGSWIQARNGSTLYSQELNRTTGEWEKDAAQYSIEAINAQQISTFGNLGKQALLSAIQTTGFGGFINKQFKSLVQATKLAGTEVKLANGWTGSIGSDGLIYQNYATGVKKWNPATKAITEDKYNDKKKAAFLAVAKRNSETSREYAQVLMNNKVYTRAQLQKMGVKKFRTGGLADYTGPAWLDGTPAKPELVLNAQDTKNFIALKDVLSKAIGSTSSVSNEYGGDATYEININVDHLNSDYDVDKVAERVKKIIVKDSSYRNVTQVRKFR